MQNSLEDKDWGMLLNRIKEGKCTPFLGAGACYGVLPLGRDIAEQWAKAEEYPMSDSSDLVRVAQFLAVKYDPMYPKERIVEMFREAPSPDFDNPLEPHRVLADLPLPVYLTTNYDDFMVRALQHRNRDPKQVLCRWNSAVSKGKYPNFEAKRDYSPTPANPVVFYLHGHREIAESLVLTEDDYLDFLVNISRDESLLPPRIQRSLADASLMFIGYRLADWNFRTLFRGLVTATEASLRRISITVQLPVPDVSEKARDEIQSYLGDYFRKIDMRIFWGTAADFVSELGRRWEAFDK
ncbi:MAG: SIR2 family NAD-dependent protein deacylase [Blastocatellia bacterium]